MSRFLLIATAAVALTGAGIAAPAHAARFEVAAPVSVQRVDYDGWREREWRRHERWEAWRRHEEWRRWHEYRGY
jgi:hypothetical protein